ncbi:MAG: hypothetical protein ACOVNR_09080 [Chitinophagaceae bacterium]
MKRLLFICFLLAIYCKTNAQEAASWSYDAIQFPQKDSLITTEGPIFVAVHLNSNSLQQISINLNNVPLLVTPRLENNLLSFLITQPLEPGSQHISIKVIINNTSQELNWQFYYLIKKDKIKTSQPTSKAEQHFKVLTGSLLIENRSTSLSGEGKELRQEPDLTRSISADMQINLGKGWQIPFKVLRTTDNRFTNFDRNYLQIGIQSKWLQLLYGDLNPTLDQLVVSGVRVKGFSAKLQVGKSYLQFIKGTLVQNGINGSINRYTPGMGFIPTTFINDTQYISPGTYKRDIVASRLELKGKKERIVLGLTSSKVKDDIKSINYGLAPKDNIAAGLDLQINMFKKTLQIKGGAAFSILTNDISGGVMDTKKFDSIYKVNIDLDLTKFSNIIIINSTSVPGFISNKRDYLAWYTGLQHKKGTHHFQFEWRTNGATYFSLANPFMRNNYNGYTVSERIGFFKRKLSINGRFQSFTNNLNENLPTTIRNNIVEAGLQLNIHPKAPSIYTALLQQKRNGISTISTVSSVDDAMQNLIINVAQPINIGALKNNIKLMGVWNNRKDAFRKNSETNMQLWQVGINSSLKLWYISADIAQNTIKQPTGEKLFDLTQYSIQSGFDIVPNKWNMSIYYTKTNFKETSFSKASTRELMTVKIKGKIAKVIQIGFEGGIAPYREQIVLTNNFDEKYLLATVQLSL